jgi:hypothetical protein
MTTHDSHWIVDAPRDEVWMVLHPQKQFDRRETTYATPRLIEHGNVRIEVVSEGDENGQGLVRQCSYAVPWYVGGKARSWEIVSEVRPPDYQRYDVLFCTPPHARATGWYRLKDVGEGRTRVDFHEEFQMESRWLAALIEGHIHRYLSKDNDVNLKGIMVSLRGAVRLFGPIR